VWSLENNFSFHFHKRSCLFPNKEICYKQLPGDVEGHQLLSEAEVHIKMHHAASIKDSMRFHFTPVTAGSAYINI
jgi:hypothetical protein